LSKFRRCPYCQDSFLPSIYRPQQVVCSQPECQGRRRADYHRKKLATDPEYRQVVRESQKQWWDEHPQYQKQRRQANPKLVENNRQRQRQRDKARLLQRLVRNNPSAGGRPSDGRIRTCAEAKLFLSRSRSLGPNSQTSEAERFRSHCALRTMMQKGCRT
jgi:hypothetical protein